MPYFEHQFEKIEEYLHHRPPYLLIKEIVEIGPDWIESLSDVQADAAFVQGHFPGAPILPGAMMQEMTTQTAGALIAARFNPMQEFNTEDPFFNEYALGVLVKIKQARYRGFARPGDQLKIRVDLESKLDSIFEFRAKISANDVTVMQNRFQLANIPSKTLQGVS